MSDTTVYFQNPYRICCDRTDFKLNSIENGVFGGFFSLQSPITFFRLSPRKLIFTGQLSYSYYNRTTNLWIEFTSNV